MPLFRYALMVITIFSLAGVPVSFAAGKPLKAKITLQPVAGSVELGQSVELQVAYSSTTTATCQWRRNKVPLSGATDSTYVIDTVLPEDAGKYDVVITNTAGSTTSRTVVLTVNLAPVSLPVDAILYGDLTLRVLGESVESDGAYLVTGATTLQDPEAPTDSYMFTYTRQPKNKARLVINGSFYDEDLGDYVASQETYSLTFTGVSAEGELLATVSGKGFFTPPEGYLPSKVGFTARGTITLQLPESSAPVSISMSAATVTLAGGNSSIVPITSVRAGSLTLSGTNTYTGTTTMSAVPTYTGTTTINNDLLLQGAIAPSHDAFIILPGPLPLGSASIVDASTVGSGSLTLSGSNTYTGTSTILSGTLSLEFASVVDATSLVVGGADLPNLSSGVLDVSGVETFGSYSFSFSVTDGILSLPLIESISGTITP